MSLSDSWKDGENWQCVEVWRNGDMVDAGWTSVVWWGEGE